MAHRSIMNKCFLWLSQAQKQKHILPSLCKESFPCGTGLTIYIYIYTYIYIYIILYIYYILYYIIYIILYILYIYILYLYYIIYILCLNMRRKLANLSKCQRDFCLTHCVTIRPQQSISLKHVEKRRLNLPQHRADMMNKTKRVHQHKLCFHTALNLRMQATNWLKCLQTTAEPESFTSFTSFHPFQSLSSLWRVENGGNSFSLLQGASLRSFCGGHWRGNSRRSRGVHWCSCPRCDSPGGWCGCDCGRCQWGGCDCGHSHWSCCLRSDRGCDRSCGESCCSNGSGSNSGSSRWYRPKCAGVYT